MTAPMRNGQHRSAFSQWIRSCPDLDSRNGFSVLDIDWCWHQYSVTNLGKSVQNLMFIEEKTWGADVGFAQKDTLRKVAQVLMSGCRNGQPQRVKIVSENGTVVMLRNWGYHLLRFSHAGPMDSVAEGGWIEWDRKRISLATLIDILRFKLSPKTLKERDERSHHGGTKQLRLGGMN